MISCNSSYFCQKDRLREEVLILLYIPAKRLNTGVQNIRYCKPRSDFVYV